MVLIEEREWKKPRNGVYIRRRRRVYLRLRRKKPDGVLVVEVSPRFHGLGVASLRSCAHLRPELLRAPPEPALVRAAAQIRQDSIDQSQSPGRQDSIE
jgi:hypothetical protein